MTVIKKIDDIGRITIPQDVRRQLRWMGGDEIQITVQKDGSILLSKNADDTVERLRELQEKWKHSPDVAKQFLELISLVENQTE